MFKGLGKIVWYNKSSSYPVFELTGVNCIALDLTIQAVQFESYVYKISGFVKIIMIKNILISLRPLA